MAELPPLEASTVRALGDARMAESKNWDSIGISMSELGSECDRALWNALRWVSDPESMTPQKLRRFETGRIEEERLIRDLKAVPGVEVWDTDPDRIGRDGKPMQWKVYSHGGHVRGKLDAVALGLPEAPKTVHVVECKSHKAEKFAELKKKGLKAAFLAHWYQCQKYMQRMGIDRCLYLAVNKNDDDEHSERIEYDPVAIMQLDARLEGVINSNRAPSRVKDGPTKFPCVICRHTEACHGEKFGRSHCRTCLHATPIIGNQESTEAKWHCRKHNRDLTIAEQRAGCWAHLFLPDVVPGEQIDAGDDFVVYQLRDGSRWVDQEKKAPTEPPAETAEPAPVCDVCGGSKVEQLASGHGNVTEQPCSKCQPLRYWFHPESNSVWESHTEDATGANGVVELDAAEYEKAIAYFKDLESQNEAHEAAKYREAKESALREETETF